MHDMAITKNFAIVFDLPSTFDFDEWQEGKSPWVTAQTLKPAFAFPRHCQDPSQVKWFSASSCQIFHTINAFEVDDGSTVVLRACRADSYTMGFDGSDKQKYWLCPTSGVDMRTKTICERQICQVRCDFRRKPLCRGSRTARTIRRTAPEMEMECRCTMGLLN